MSDSAIKRLLAAGRGDGLRAQLLRGGVGSLGIKAGHAMLAFAVAVVLARTLGPEGYGVYSFALAIIMLTAIPAQIGVPQLMVRETAKAQANGNYGLMRGLWRWGNVAVALFSALALAVVAGILWFTDVGGDGARVATLTIGIALIPVIALANVRGACLRGLRKVVQGQLPESIIRPALLLFLVLVWGTWFVEDELTPQMAMGFYVVAAVLAFIIGAWLLRRSRPAELGERPTAEYQSSAWRKAVIPLGMITGLQLINNYADLIILGIFRTDEEVGIYRAAFQFSMLVTFIMIAINQVVQPYFAKMHEIGDFLRMRKLLDNASKLTLFLTLPIVVIFVFFNELLLVSIFGPDYISGGLALAILVTGSFAKSVFGYGHAVLMMAGYEREVLRFVVWSGLANVLINLILVPILGIEGAAVGTAVTMGCLFVVLFLKAKKMIGLMSS